MIIATPGRMIDLMDKQVAKMDQCRMLVLDEADKLLSQDFKGMLDMVISRLVFVSFMCNKFSDQEMLNSASQNKCHVPSHNFKYSV